MAEAYFIDSSALVKRYVQEDGTAWVRRLTRRSAARRIYLSRITAVEVTSAVRQEHQDAGFAPVTLVSSDQALNAAAAVEGLAVDDPRSHP